MGERQERQAKREYQQGVREIVIEKKRKKKAPGVNTLRGRSWRSKNRTDRIT